MSNVKNVRVGSAWRIGVRSSAGALALIVGTLAAAEASAQQADPTPLTTADKNTPATDGTPGEDIVVTASRIERSGFEAPTPTTVLGTRDLKSTAKTNLADVLNESPQFRGSTTPATTTRSSQQAAGNFLALRGLGPDRTLVLVNGNRHVPTSQAGLIDINVLPSALVQRVEVVTGGASAAWGSDAVAGVVNLILRDHIDGVEGSAQYGLTQYGDYRDVNATLAAGQSFADGRLKIMVAGEYDNNKGIDAAHSRKRDWVDAGFARIANPTYTAANGEAQTLAVGNVHVSAASLNGLITSGPLRGTEFLPGGGTRAFQYGTSVGASYMVGGDGINFGREFGTLVTPLERGSIYSHSTFQVTDHLKLFADVSWSTSRTTFLLTPTYDLGTITIRRDNAYLPPAVVAQMTTLNLQTFTLGRISPDVALTLTDNDNNTYRSIAGAGGDFPLLGSTAKWNIHYEWGRSRYASRLLNNRINANYTNAIDAVVSPTGTIVCRSTLTAPTNGCVPLNLFGAGSPSAAARAYVTGTQSLIAQLTENNAAADLQFEPFNTWAGPVSLAVGGEYRREQVSQTVDALSQASAFNVGNPKPLVGAYSIKEGFAEVIVPLAANSFFAKSLDFNGAVRYTDYSTSGTVTTWKVGLSWALTGDFRLRGTRSHDIRAPNLSDLFATNVLTFATVIDPIYKDQQQVGSPSEGNPDLKPEQADTTVLGGIYEPSWLHGLRISADWYRIDIKDAISTLSAQNILDRCAAGNTALCAFITRDANGRLSRDARIVRRQVNLNNVINSGVDLELGYNFRLDSIAASLPGEMSLRVFGTYVKDLITDDGITRVNRGGNVGENGGAPHWRWNGSASYSTGPLRVFLQGIYIGGGPYDSTVSNLVSPYSVKSQFVANLGVNYKLIGSDRRSVEIFGAINNLLNQDPPYDPTSFINANSTNVGLYDYLGRRFSAGLRFKI